MKKIEVSYKELKLLEILRSDEFSEITIFKVEGELRRVHASRRLKRGSIGKLQIEHSYLV